MDELSPGSPTERVVVMAARQVAKTEILLNFLGHSIECDPAPFLLVQPTINNAKNFSKQRLKEMLDTTASLRARVSRHVSRKSSNTLLTKEFDDGILILGGANSSASLRSMPVKRLAMDERNEYPEDVDGQGDPGEIAEECTANFPGRKVLILGNPGIRGLSSIHREFLRGDQRRLFVPCLRCGEFDLLTWRGRDWFDAKEGKHHEIVWEPGRPSTAAMVCSRCQERHPEETKTEILAAHQWRPTAVGDGTRSYHIPGLASPYGFRSWARCAGQFQSAKDSPPRLRAFVNNVLGETFEERGNKVEAKDLLRDGRREDYGAEVPHGVGVLVSTTDTQDDRLIQAIWGFGVGEEMWLIDVDELDGDPRKDVKGPDMKTTVWLDHDLALRRRFRHRSGRMMRIRRAVIDSGGHATDQVYRYCATRRSEGVFAIHGDKTQQQPLVGPARVNKRHRLRVFSLCVDTGRADIVARLGMLEAGPGYIHLPATLEDEYVRQLASTRGRWIWSGGRLVREWTLAYHARDHMFDLAVYALAAYRMLGKKFHQTIARRVKLLSTPAPDAPPPPAAEGQEPPDDAPAPAPPAQPKPAPPRPRFGNDFVSKALPPGRRWRRW